MAPCCSWFASFAAGLPVWQHSYIVPVLSATRRDAGGSDVLSLGNEKLRGATPPHSPFPTPLFVSGLISHPGLLIGASGLGMTLELRVFGGGAAPPHGLVVHSTLLSQCELMQTLVIALCVCVCVCV